MLNLDITQFVVLGAVLVGANEIILRARAKDWWVVATIVIGAVIGAIFGAIHFYPGVDVPTGIAIALGASGVIKTLSSFGNKSTPAPSDAVVK